MFLFIGLSIFFHHNKYYIITIIKIYERIKQSTNFHQILYVKQVILKFLILGCLPQLNTEQTSQIRY